MMDFLADENLNGIILDGLRARIPLIDIERVQDVGLRKADDPTILAWAANHDRIVLTHDVKTMKAHAEARVAAGLALPGVLEIHAKAPVRLVLDELEIIYECSTADEWRDQVRFIPLR